MSEIKNPFETIENYNIKHHAKICKEMNVLYERKNHDYGDSFHHSFEEEGMAMVRIRLGDKLNRFKTLTKGNEQLVDDESIRDLYNKYIQKEDKKSFIDELKKSFLVRGYKGYNFCWTYIINK